jgi:Tryptophan synthase alpha chain
MRLYFHDKPALVAYLTCGDPDLRTTCEIALAAISAGAEVIELGVPFSDPKCERPETAVKLRVAGGLSSCVNGIATFEPGKTPNRFSCLLLGEPQLI